MYELLFFFPNKYVKLLSPKRSFLTCYTLLVTASASTDAISYSRYTASRVDILAFLKPNCRNLAFLKVVGLRIFGLAFK